jgi:hypothetical protein
MDVRKLQIFDRYGIKVYGQMNYTDQWKVSPIMGMNFQVQPIIMLWNNSKSKTGWIYLIRKNSYLVNLCWYLMSTK